MVAALKNKKMSVDTKQLVDKFINGEIDETEFDAQTSGMTPEEKTEKDKLLEEGKKNILKEIVGLRKTKEATIEKNNASLSEKLQKENLEAAKIKFFSDMGIDKDDDKKSFEEGFKTESINVENIIQDMKTRYVAMNPDKYLNLEIEKKNREKEAEEYNAEGAGGSGTGGGENLNKVSKEVKEHIALTLKMTGRTLTPEQAERALKIKAQGGHIATI